MKLYSLKTVKIVFAYNFTTYFYIFLQRASELAQEHNLTASALYYYYYITIYLQIECLYSV